MPALLMRRVALPAQARGSTTSAFAYLCTGQGGESCRRWYHVWRGRCAWLP